MTTWEEWKRETPGMMEHLGGYPLRSLVCEIVDPERYYITASELARLAHSVVIAKCGPCRYEPERFIAKLAKHGARPTRYHGRPPVYDVRAIRAAVERAIQRDRAEW